ncbi:MAG: YsnF/AvaK domain-containing protein [Geminicoccaceae bacterium]
MLTKDHPQIITLTEEHAEITKRAIERGRVAVRTHTESRDELVEIALQQADVTVERVPIGLPVEVAPAMREEDGVLIVPVLEEQLVVSIRLMLKEEIRITRQVRTEVVQETVCLRSERAVIERLQGRPIPPSTQETESGS